MRHPEPVDRMRGFRVAAEEEVQRAEPEQPERGDGEAHDGAAEERDREGFVAAPVCAATVVRTFARVAVLMPMRPAAADATAPAMKESAVL